MAPVDVDSSGYNMENEIEFHGAVAAIVAAFASPSTDTAVVKGVLKRVGQRFIDALDKEGLTAKQLDEGFKFAEWVVTRR